MSNGGGGAGVAGAPGFGYDPDGGNNYSLPRNTDGQMDLFRVPGMISLPSILQRPAPSPTYTSSDVLGNSSTAIRTIIVTEDQGQPFLTLVGETDVIHEAGTHTLTLEPRPLMVMAR